MFKVKNNYGYTYYPEEHIKQKMVEFNSLYQPPSFILAMRNRFEELTLYERSNQPCYGELRKYKKTHGDECHKPESKPSDLHHPFPDGIPEAVGVPYRYYDYSSRSYDLPEEPCPFLKYILSDESPWKRGFIDSKNVEFTKKDGKFTGMIFLDTAFDPTVFVNLLNVIRSIYPKMYDEAIEVGLPPRKALALCMSMTSGGTEQSKGYYFPRWIDLVRFEDQDPRDLSGGTLRDRYDYDRKFLHTIFETTKEVGFDFWPEFHKKFRGGKQPWMTLQPGWLTQEVAEFFSSRYDESLLKQKEQHAPTEPESDHEDYEENEGYEEDEEVYFDDDDYEEED